MLDPKFNVGEFTLYAGLTVIASIASDATAMAKILLMFILKFLRVNKKFIYARR